MTLEQILQAACIAAAKGVDGPLNFMYRDPVTNKLYMTETMYEMYWDEVPDPENIVIVPNHKP